MSILRDFPDLPPIWAAGTVVVQWTVDRFAPVLQLQTGLLGWLFVAVGAWLAVWSLVWFQRKRTSFEPRETPTALIVEGPFRLNRNPIYTGMVVALIGTGLLFGSLLSVALALPFAWIITRRFILDEEAALRAAFGEAADRYIAATRRW